MTRRRRRSRLVGVALLVLLLEGAWQLTALVVSALGSAPAPPTDPDAALVVLCEGDSNTFGLDVAAWSYPNQLRPQLDARYRADVQVVNRGVPGWNSAQVTTDGLARDLEVLAPDLVLLLAGINDAWNDAAMPDRPWYSHLKLVEFVMNVSAGDTNVGRHDPKLLTDDKGELLVQLGDEVRAVNPGSGDLLREGEALARSVRANMSRALDLCEDAGARAILMTYAESGGNFTTVNAALRDLAAERDVPLVDHAERFAREFEAGRYTELMLDNKHPNAAGYALMTRSIMQTLDELGWVPPEGTAGDVAADRPPPPPPSLGLADDGSLLLEGPPGWTWQLAVAEAASEGEPGYRVPGFELQLREGPALTFSLAQPAFTGRFDASGRHALKLPRALRDKATAPLRAVLVLLRDPGEPSAASAPVAARSAPLELPEG